MYGIPKNFFGLLGDFYDGFEHGPRMIGSEVRELGKVDGVLSGVYQGLAGAFTGLYDGFTGLVKEPMRGQKEEVRLQKPEKSETHLITAGFQGRDEGYRAGA